MSTSKLANKTALLLTFLFILNVPNVAASQTLSKMDRDRGHSMLRAIKGDIQKSYYDPEFHGVDLEARFKAADQKIDQATSLGQVFGIIAQALLDFNDSHTFFLPPSRVSRTDYGWQMQMIGAACYVIAVKPGSDAEAKGLRPGDRVVSVNGYNPTRDTLWQIQYLFYTLRPVPGLRVVLAKPDGSEKQVDVLARVRPGKRVFDLTGQDGGTDIWNLIRESESEDRIHRHRYIEMGTDLMIWRMPEFDLSENQVDDIMGKAMSRRALILDLRGNPGGNEVTLLRLIGHLFDHDVTVGEIKRRKETKPLIAKSRNGHVFAGKLVLLTDSRSGSAAEVLARVVQLEHRGTVIGDQTAGAVMRSISHEHQIGTDTVIFYGASVTDADLLMADGKSLEGVGVKPDQISVPTAADLAAGRDPILSRAAASVAIKIEPEKAGTLFPIEWKK